MMLSDTPARLSGANVTSTEIGIETATMIVDLMSRRNRNRMMIARKPPEIAVSRTSAMLDSMNSERSVRRSMSAPYSRLIRGFTVRTAASVTRVAMSTMLASASL
jgi:hypothetical protein